ncbi:FecR domain-containing protein [Sphingomonadaceae bacterium jetA1]|jgi:transmembrane sensor|uniref:FecR family protein n=1 Tax=Facivitalis istanbulensis TaxID=3075838 RepID=UPI003477406C
MDGTGWDGDEACQREALDWMILLQERPDDDAVRAQFRQWRRAPCCDAAWRELDRVDALIAQAGPFAVVTPVRAARRWNRLAPLAMAACVALLVTWQAASPFDRAWPTTGTGEVRIMRLADGSRVTLAPHSAVAIDGPSAREVRLLRGTGFFEVRHDAAHPFRVLAGEAVATDLGTAFEVRREEDVTRIAVREGQVRASCTHDAVVPVELNPGDTVALDCAEGRSRTSSAPPSAMASWTQGHLLVTDRPLGDVVEALRPWYRGLLVARGAGMARHVTGVYDLRHPDRALAAIQMAHGVTVRQVTPWIIIVTAD